MGIFWIKERELQIFSVILYRNLSSSFPVDDHIMPNVKEGLDFMGEKVAENVDMLAEVVMGTEAKTETAKALETLHHAVMPNEKQVCTCKNIRRFLL